jgi:hypothetical protein
MALRTAGALAFGFAAGWIARSVVGSTREAVIGAVVLLDGVRHEVTRIVAEQVERIQDFFAEGRAHYEAERARSPVDDASPPRVVPLRRRTDAA